MNSFRLTGSLLREKKVSPKSSRRRNTTPTTIAQVKPQVLAEISALSQAGGWSRAARATKRVHCQLEQISETPCQNKSEKRAGELRAVTEHKQGPSNKSNKRKRKIEPLFLTRFLGSMSLSLPIGSRPMVFFIPVH